MVGELQKEKEKTLGVLADSFFTYFCPSPSRESPIIFHRWDTEYSFMIVLWALVYSANMMTWWVVAGWPAFTVPCGPAVYIVMAHCLPIFELTDTLINWSSKSVKALLPLRGGNNDWRHKLGTYRQLILARLLVSKLFVNGTTLKNRRCYMGWMMTDDSVFVYVQ